MAVRALADRHGLQLRGSRQAADAARGTIAGVPVLLAVPHTFMNESGVAVSRLARFYKVQPERLLVVYDDIDIPFGTIRLRPEGGSGGNNGLKSIIASLGTEDFPRLRLGVGRPPRGAVEHVLSRFPPEQERLLPELLTIADDAIEETLRSGTLDAMNRYNRDWLTYLTGAEEARS
jgi:PTH1 family peptidyl-tRNA hydrolase